MEEQCVATINFFFFTEVYGLDILEKRKDPGIPNDFPYKDQILAEVQEQRRIVSPP
jgi:hypothetical protein